MTFSCFYQFLKKKLTYRKEIYRKIGKLALRMIICKYNFLGHKVIYNKRTGFDFQKNLFIIIADGWNNLDAVLPVMRWIKLKGIGCCITVLFIYDNVLVMMEKEKSRFETLQEFADNIMLPKVHKIISESKKKSILKSIFNDIKKTANSAINISTWYKQILKKEFKGRRKIDAIIMGLDKEFVSASLFFRKEFPSSIIVGGNLCFCSFKPDITNEWVKKNPFPFDYYLSVDRLYYSKVTEPRFTKKIRVVGEPRLDKWWIFERQNENEVSRLRDSLCLKNRKIIVYIFSTVDDDSRLNNAEKKQFCLFLEAHKQYVHIFKFHPRNTQQTISTFIEEYVPKDTIWILSDLESIQLAALADVMIVVGYTSGISDFILSGVPVIQFYDSFRYRNYFYEMSNNRYADFYQLHDLLFHADNQNELSKYFDDCVFLNGWEKYDGKFHEYLPEIENSSELIVNLLLDKRTSD